MGTALGDALADGLGEPITTGAVVVGTVTGDPDGDADADAEGLAEGLALGATAVKKLPLGVAEELPAAVVALGVVHAVVAASTVRAPQLIAASLARPPMEPPGTGAP
jgi:hypothetical protein